MITTGSFRRADRLCAKSDFDQVFANARRSGDRCFTVLFCDNDAGHARLGLAIAKRRVRSAVARNRLKRIARESFRRQQSSLPAVDIVVMAGAAAESLANADAFASLDKHWKKIRTAGQRP